MGDETVASILIATAARRIVGRSARFCRTPDCDVVYYGADGAIATKQESVVRVGVKETDDPIQLCYCFGYTRADVAREIGMTGVSTIPDRIAAEVKAGRCSCTVKNPSGACCLGEIAKAVGALSARRS